ncbi:hypothetical protein ACLOJK_005799 [Asimina triloba]
MRKNAKPKSSSSLNNCRRTNHRRCPLRSIRAVHQVGNEAEILNLSQPQPVSTIDGEILRQHQRPPPPSSSFSAMATVGNSGRLAAMNDNIPSSPSTTTDPDLAEALKAAPQPTTNTNQWVAPSTWQH